MYVCELPDPHAKGYKSVDMLTHWCLDKLIDFQIYCLFCIALVRQLTTGKQNSPDVFKHNILCQFNRECHTDSIYWDNYPGELSINRPRQHSCRNLI